MKIKRFTILFLVFSLVFVIGGLKAQATTLNVIIGDFASDTLEPYFNQFEEETGIEVEYEAYPFRELFETIEVRNEAESNNVDVIFVDSPVTSSYAIRGLIDPLEEHFSQELENNIWYDTTEKAGSWNGTLYSAPLNEASQVMYYNKDLLSENNIEFPSTDLNDRWTWEHIVEAGKKITDKDTGTWGFIFQSVNLYNQIQPLPSSLGGGSGVIDDGQKADITNEEWVEAMTFYHNLFNKWEIAPKGVGFQETADLFASGKVGFYISGLWDVPYFEQSDVNFGVAPHPYFEEGTPATPSNSWHLGLWSYSENKSEALKLIKYLTTNPEVQVSRLEEQGEFPAIIEAIETIEEKPKYQENPWIAYKIGAQELEKTAITRAETPAYLEFENILSTTFENIRNGAEPEKELQKAEEEINQKMQRYQF